MSCSIEKSNYPENIVNLSEEHSLPIEGQSQHPVESTYSKDSLSSIYHSVHKNRGEKETDPDMRARSFIQMAKTDIKRKAFDLALEAILNGFSCKSTDSDIQGELYLTKTKIFMNQGLFDRASNTIELGLDCAKTKNDIRADLLLQRSLLFLREIQLNDAVKTAKMGLDCNPLNHNVFKQLSKIANELGVQKDEVVPISDNRNKAEKRSHSSREDPSNFKKMKIENLLN